MSVTFKNASLIKRLLSTLYDGLILIAVSFLYFFALTMFSLFVFGNDTENYQPNVGGLAVQIGWGACIIAFYCFFWLKVGQTVAMKAWKIRLVSTSNSELTPQQCVVRCLTGFLSLSCFGLGYFWILVDKDKLALHDRISKTRVVALPKELA
jgi:uncharacterized RDD family membrane protein YckC